MTPQEKNLRRRSSEAELRAYEDLLSQNLRDVVAELYLVDPGIFVGYIANNLHANIEDIVESATELFFKPGTLRYSHAADCHFEWDQNPQITLDLEFVHSSTTVFFKLILQSFYVTIAIRRVMLNDRSGDPDADLRRFGNVLADARILTLPSPIGPEKYRSA